MLEAPLRQAATILLQSAIQIAPPDTREWGQAMQSELAFVEGPWAALMWALGGASVMAKHAVAALIIPGRNAIPDGGLFAKSPTLRKAALFTGGVCVLVAILFFWAPPFRQAFQVALHPWYHLFQGAARNPEAGFRVLAQRAEDQRDPEGMAFCAVRLQDPSASIRLADEAVRLDPNLAWVYAVVAMRNPGLPEADVWVERLQRTDPQNALFPLITAESVEMSHFRHGDWTPSTKEQERAWQSAMAAAFQSPKFDDYLDRVAQLNRQVIPRYSYYDPYEVESRITIDLPIHAFQNSERYAKLLLSSGAALETKGDRRGAREQYWTVARFGQMLDSQGRTPLEHWMGTTLQAMAYRQLQASANKEGNQAESAHFAYLAEKFDASKGVHAGMPGESAFGISTAERNAAVVEISGLMILLFSGLGMVGLAILIAASRRTAPPVAQRAQPMATIVVLTSAVGLLFSSVTLYLTYRPYWYIFQSAIQSGDRVPTSDLRMFLRHFPMLPGISPRGYAVLLNALLYSGSPSFLFYVWTGVALLCVCGLAVILLRHILGRPHAHAP